MENLKEIKKTAYFKKRQIKDKTLLVNEYGFFSLFKASQKDIFKNPKNIAVLRENNFFNNELNIQEIKQRFKEKFYFSWKGPHTHIISLTRKCSNACAYCAVECLKKGENASFSAVKRIIDFIFEIPQEEFFIEFTGGEPTLNFEVFKKAVHYIKTKSEACGKKTHIAIVTNLSYKDNNVLDFLIKNRISICSSLDGPKKIHDTLRKTASKESSYSMVVENICRLNHYAEKGLMEPISLISTITKLSVGYEKQIIDEYVKNKVFRVQLGMVEPLGRAVNEDIFMSAKEYLSFYLKALLYMKRLNEGGKFFLYEKGLSLIAKDILNGLAPAKRSVDIYHRLAYDISGFIYPCDEARILGETGDKSLSIGNVFEDGFKDLLVKEKTKLFMLYFNNSYLSPRCFRCPYSLFCRVPVYYNYAAQNSFLGNMITSSRCEIFMGIFDIFFNNLNKKHFPVSFIP